jgi:hypothetical protein
MSILRGLFWGALGIIVPFLTFLLSDTLEGTQREQYDQLAVQQNVLQGQIDSLVSLKSQIDGLIGQISSVPTDNYSQEADRYRQLELLLPSATRYSQELAQRTRQMEQIRGRKAELRSKILQRRSDLPVWWRE